MRLLFGDFCLDTDRRELLGAGSTIHLTPKALQLLRILIESRPRMMSREELHEYPSTADQRHDGRPTAASFSS